MLILVLPVNLILLIFRAPDEIPIILGISAFLFGLGLLSLRMLLWFINGKEVVQINDGHLIITKTGTFWLKKERQFALIEIKSFALNLNFFETNSPSDLVGKFSRRSYIFRIQNTGRIELILADFRSYRFLDNIDFDEATTLIEQLKIRANIT